MRTENSFNVVPRDMLVEIIKYCPLEMLSVDKRLREIAKHCFSLNNKELVKLCPLLYDVVYNKVNQDSDQLKLFMKLLNLLHEIEGKKESITISNENKLEREYNNCRSLAKKVHAEIQTNNFGNFVRLLEKELFSTIISEQILKDLDIGKRWENILNGKHDDSRIIQTKSLTDLTKLTLKSKFNFCIIPGEISKLPNLDTVVINSTAKLLNLTAINSLEKFTTVIISQVSGEHLENILLAVSKLSHLKNLQIHESEIKAWPFEMSQLKSLETLEFKTCRVTSPINLTALNSLEKFTTVIIRDVKDQHLENILLAVYKLSSLKKLEINNCSIRALPSGVNQLKSLETLDFKSNELRQLPDEMSQLGKLEKLSISENNTRSPVDFPAIIFKLPELNELHISDTKFKPLSSAIGQLKKLKILECVNNQWVNVPKEIGQLANLEKLSLSKNPIGQIPDLIFSLSQLTVLELSEMNLPFIPPKISQLTNLRRLDLSKNNFATDSYLKELDSLTLDELDITNTTTNFLQISLNKLPKTKENYKRQKIEIKTKENIKGFR